MKEYTWEFEEFIFTLKISELKERYNNEGIHQDVIFDIYNKDEKTTINILDDYNWGLENYINNISKQNKNFNYSSKIQLKDGVIYFLNKKKDNEIYFRIMDKKSTKEFLDWLNFCNLPLVKQRKIKLEKWKEKQLD